MNGIDLIKARAFGAGDGSGGSGGSGGGSAQLDAFLDGSATEVVSNVTEVRKYAFYKYETLTKINLPSVKTLGNYALAECGITDITLPVATEFKGTTFRKCLNLVMVDLPAAVSLGAETFFGASNLKALIIRSGVVCTIPSTTVFNGTQIASSTGYIYVPSALVDTYKAATNWSSYASQFRALEDYTVDGTIYGEMDWAKMAA